MREYLDSWGRDLAGAITPLVYEDLFHCRMLRTGTYIFSDVERLRPTDAQRAADIRTALARAGLRVLNDPLRSMRRYELLRALHREGINQFNVYRVRDDERPRRFPVFLRIENDHGGSLTGLIPTAEALDTALRELQRTGRNDEDLLITEFCDTSSHHGVYRKYSAFMIGGRVVPGHVFYAHEWLVKFPSLLEPEMLAEEQRYIDTNPHEEQLLAIFRLARIDYGRIDYAVLDGTLQVWELNTNPWIMSYRDIGSEERLPARVAGAAALRAAFMAIADQRPPARVPIPLQAGVFDSWRASLPTHLGRALLRRTGLLWHEETLRTTLLRLRGRQPTPPGATPST